MEGCIPILVDDGRLGGVGGKKPHTLIKHSAKIRSYNPVLVVFSIPFCQIDDFSENKEATYRGLEHEQNKLAIRKSLVTGASMAGVGEIASVASFISLSFQLFDGCIKGFVLLSAAQELGSRGDVLACQLEWEHYRLHEWARTAGLFNDPPELNVSNPALVQHTLGNLEQLLTNAKKLKEDYGLDVTLTEEEIHEVHTPNRLFGYFLDKTKPQFINDTAKVYARRNNAWKKMKWGAVDSEKLRLLLKDVRKVFDSDEIFLFFPHQNFMRTNSTISFLFL